MSRNLAYRPASLLVAWVSALLIGDAILSLIAIWSDGLEIQLLNDAVAGASITEAQAYANDTRQGLIGLVQLGLFIPLVILFSVWLYRANRNARSLGAEDMKFSPGWCVGWFFVPIMNLFKPYQAVKEIWKASDPDLSQPWHQGNVPPLLGLWWAFWILSGFINNASFRLSLRADGLQEVLYSSWLVMSSDILDIPLAVLALLVVRNIHGLQERKYIARFDDRSLDGGIGLPATREVAWPNVSSG